MSQLCKALVDVAAQSNQQNNGVGSLTTTLVCCELSQLLVQGMLPNDSLLYQIPHFTTDIVEMCRKQTVTDDEGKSFLSRDPIRLLYLKYVYIDMFSLFWYYFRHGQPR